MDHVRACRERPIALGNLGPEEHDDVDPGERREVRRSRVVRHQHVGEIEQMQELLQGRAAGEIQHARRGEPLANVLRVGLLAGDARDQDENVGVFQQCACELSERFERHAPQGKAGARVGIEHHELAGGADVGSNPAELCPDLGGRGRVGRDLRNLEAVLGLRPFHSRHVIRRRVESVDEIEKRVRGMDVRVVEHFVGQQIARVQPFLIEPMEADASGGARQIAQHAAVPDERLHVDDRVDAVAASAPRKGNGVARE